MEKTIVYKKQGNGQDSWFINYIEDGKPVQAPELVYGLTVENWRLKAVLSQRGLLTAVETALNNLPEPTKTTALFAWEYSNTVSTSSNTTKLIQDVLGLTIHEVVDIFWQAINLDI